MFKLPFIRFRRAAARELRAQIHRGIAQVEAAYLNLLMEMGVDEDDLPTNYSVRKIGVTESGINLWEVWDWYGSWYFLDEGDGAELFVQMSEERGEHMLSEAAEAAIAPAVIKELGFDRELWATSLWAAIENHAAAAKPVVKQELPGPYTVVKADEEQRYTLGVAYPHSEIDSHGDFTTAEELEKAAWQFMANGAAIGTDHAEGTDGAGTAVESYVWRGPDWEIDGETVAKTGDWMLGAVWTEDSWDRIKKGELAGWSIQGLATREEVEAPEGVE